jgi:hypothetical protein
MKVSSGCSAVLALLCVWAEAQETPKPAIPPVEEIVTRVQRNVGQTLTSLPDFLCDEHLTEQVFVKRELGDEVEATSTLRVMRRSSKSQGYTFTESRETKSIRRKVNRPWEYTAPGGWLGGNLQFWFSPEVARCLNFALISTRKLNGADLLVITATNKADVNSLGGVCSQHRYPGYGVEAWIDPQSMQIVHIGAKDHPLEFFSGELGSDTWSLDYTRISIDGSPFWMPDSVRREIVDVANNRRWRMTHEYSNYHKFIVKSKILLDGAADK